MTDFGSYLRTAREERQLTLDALATCTKIKRQLLADLEANNLARWPKHRVYRHGFLRAYAVAVRLDPDDLIAEFEREFPDDPTLHSAQQSKPQATAPSPERVTSVGAIIAVSSGLLLALALQLLNGHEDRGLILAKDSTSALRSPADIRLAAETMSPSTSVADTPAEIERELLIISDPSDASVTVNGIGRGRTPARVQYLPLGSYTIRLVRSGCESRERVVTLTAEQPVRTVRFALRQAAQSAIC